MASVLAIVSKAVFGDLPVWREGQIAALDRYKTKNAAFANLDDGDAIFLVTVRDNDVLWLIAIIEKPKKKGDVWSGAINRTPIVDITKLVKKLVLASGEGITAKRGKLGMSLQTPRVLADEDVVLLRKAAPKSGEVADEAVVMDLRGSNKRKRAKAAAKSVAEGSVPNKGGRPSAAAQKLVEQVYAAPDDLGLRAVLADKLLEEHHVWGELISLQMADPKKHAKRIDHIIKMYGGDICGPIIHVSTRENLEFRDGFLVGCRATKSLAWGGVGRKQWDQAASAPQWATLEHIYMSNWSTPVWWIEKWMTTAPLANLRSVKIETCGIERDAPSAPWRLITPKNIRRLDLRFHALLKSLPAEELARIPPPPHEGGRLALEKARAPAPAPRKKARKRRRRSR